MASEPVEEHSISPSDHILRANEVAEILRTTPGHVLRLAEIGEMGSVRIGRFVRFTQADVAQYLASHRVVPKTLEQPKDVQALLGFETSPC